MGWGRWWSALSERLSRARDRLVARFPEGLTLRSREDYEREIQRLQRELETVRAKRERERSEFQARHGIIQEYPSNGGMPAGELDRQLANLHRIRTERLLAEEHAYAQQIRELERQFRDRFGH